MLLKQRNVKEVWRVWPECLRVWVMRLLLWLNAFPHTTHLCGFSPVIIIIIIIIVAFIFLYKLRVYTCCQKAFCEILWVLFYKNGSCQNLCCTHSPETHIWPKPFWYINNFTRTHTDCILHQQKVGISSLRNIGSVSQYIYRWLLLMNLTCVNVSMLLHVRLLVKSFPAVLTGIWPSTRTI